MALALCGTLVVMPSHSLQRGGADERAKECSSPYGMKLGELGTRAQRFLDRCQGEPCPIEAHEGTA